MTDCRAIWETKPKFCASLANGYERCPKGTCQLIEPEQTCPSCGLRLGAAAALCQTCQEHNDG